MFAECQGNARAEPETLRCLILLLLMINLIGDGVVGRKRVDNDDNSQSDRPRVAYRGPEIMFFLRWHSLVSRLLKQQSRYGLSIDVCKFVLLAEASG